MICQSLATLKVTTKERGFHEITRDVQECVAQAAVQTGLCTLHLQHTSASLLIQENAEGSTCGSIVANRTRDRSSCTSLATNARQ